MFFCIYNSIYFVFASSAIFFISSSFYQLVFHILMHTFPLILLQFSVLWFIAQNKTDRTLIQMLTDGSTGAEVKIAHKALNSYFSRV